MAIVGNGSRVKDAIDALTGKKEVLSIEKAIMAAERRAGLQPESNKDFADSMLTFCEIFDIPNLIKEQGDSRLQQIGNDKAKTEDVIARAKEKIGKLDHEGSRVEKAMAMFVK